MEGRGQKTEDRGREGIPKILRYCLYCLVLSISQKDYESFMLVRDEIAGDRENRERRTEGRGRPRWFRRSSLGPRGS
jgi:hypothetical protein